MRVVETGPGLGGTKRTRDRVKNLVAGALIAVLRVYKLAISPFLPRACRFYPTCSAYAAEAIAEHGALRGVWMGAARLLRCHPFHPGGHDPVPRRHGSEEAAPRG